MDKVSSRLKNQASSVRQLADGRTIEGRKAGRLSERIRDYVRDEIIRGELRPGSILQIASLAQRMGVSRTPAREALLALQSSGLLEVAPNQGFVVRAVTLSDVADVYVMRRLIESATAERASTRASDEMRERLVRINELTIQEGSSGRWTPELDDLARQFHLGIAEAAGSPRMLTAMINIFDDADRIRSLGQSPPSRAENSAEHTDILNAILDRDAAEARRLMEVHIDSMRRSAISAAFAH